MMKQKGTTYEITNTYDFIIIIIVMTWMNQIDNSINR
jgi:hypothetical protein